jgi:chromosome segregation ATPase
MNPSVKASLKSTIMTLDAKSAEITEADFSVKTAVDNVRSAQQKITQTETKVTTFATQLEDINSRLSDPPKIETNTGGKNSQTVMQVDQNELKKLKADADKIKTQIASANEEVQTARDEAEVSSNKALEAAGIKQNHIQELNDLQVRVNSMQKFANEKIPVSNEDLTKLSEDIEAFSSQFTKEDNKGDVLGYTFYDPLARDLKKLISTIESNEAKKDPNAPPPEGTIERKLFDINIKGEKNNSFINLMDKVVERNNRLDSGESFSKSQMRTMYSDFQILTHGLTGTQKNSEVIKGFKEDMEALVTKSGHGDILTESGS